MVAAARLCREREAHPALYAAKLAEGVAICGNHLSVRDFQTLLKRAGLPRIWFHDLCHTCATALLRRGVHPRVVSELLGHLTVTMTLDRYSHDLPDM